MERCSGRFTPQRWGASVFVVLTRLVLALTIIALLAFGAAAPAAAMPPEQVLRDWYGLILKLVRHTPTYSPPVASRAFAYLGVTAFEAAASGTPNLGTLAGQLNGLTAVPRRETGKIYSDAVVLDAALAASAQAFFSNTGPTGQRAMAAFSDRQLAEISKGVPADVIERSQAVGRAIAGHMLAWSQNDGGAVVENLGFPAQYAANGAPGHWAPTSRIALQQTPLLPSWGKNRTFALKDGAACPLPAPPEYSEDKASEFYAQAQEVYQTSKALTDEQRAIARFWSDDPMLSPTPPGHWISIALQILEQDHRGLEDSLHRLLAHQIPVRPAAAGSVHPQADRSQMGAADRNPSVPGISQRPQHAIWRGGGGVDKVLWRDLRLRGCDAYARWLAGAKIRQLPGGSR
jgi:hypothetical protein